MKFLCAAILALAVNAAAQSPCPATPHYSPCDIVFELNDGEAAAHPNPYLTVEIRAEFRSPRHRTLLLPAFWDGGRRMVIRFTPNEVGEWDYRISGNIQRFAGGLGKLTATVSEAPGFIRVANVHHFAYTEERKPHLWMGDTSLRFAFLDATEAQQLTDTREAEKFNHMRLLAIGGPEDAKKIFPTPDTIDPAHFQRLDERIVMLNRKGIVADLLLASANNHLTALFPTWQQRERYVRYMAARYSGMNLTWQGVEEFESYENGRPLMKEIGLLLKKSDPYQHPRSSHARLTSAPLLEDGWMDYVVYQTADNQLGSVEHQLFAAPFVNTGFGKGAADADAFRKLLWNATMDGQYVTLGPGGDPKQMTVWFDFFSASRHWDLEPHFDVDGGRAVALEEIEYIVYLEKPVPVEILMERHGYDVAWFNPINGEFITQKKDFKGEKFSGEPPDDKHDWVLRLSRESKKESMLKSYRFEARRIVPQEVEQDAQKVPFEITAPLADELSVAKAVAFSSKLKRETRASKQMKYVWTGEVAADGQGYRVIGTGAGGTFQIPRDVATKFPAVLHLRLTGLNGVGKLYSVDRIYKLVP
ncbi:MAG: DUF5060 domain-containing protein [Bryobacteraceae bacterium]